MYIASEDARTDVILAGATTVFGSAVWSFVASLPLYPQGALVGGFLDVLWILALTALVPVLLARHRGDGAAALGLSGPSGRWPLGLLYLVPVGLLGLGIELLLGRELVPALLGRLAGPAGTGSPTVLLLTVAQIAALTVGALVLVGFLAVRGREAYPGSPLTPLTGLVRTVGLVAVIAAAVLGFVRVLTGASGAVVALHVVALAAVLLVTERFVPRGVTPPRTVVVTPLIVVLLAQLTATGGIIFGDLASGLYATALALGATVAVAVLTQTTARAWAALPLLVAVHWWPTCLSPLTIAPGIC